MRTRLQYAYSITVFLGALATAYLMMNQEPSRVSNRLLASPTFRSEAAAMDQAMSQLIEVGSELAKIPKGTPSPASLESERPEQ